MAANATRLVERVFVLMLENRSLDHMLGFSGITGKDAQTGQPTAISGLSGSESNTYNGLTFDVSQRADWTMPLDPGHEFTDVLVQLCGPGAVYHPGGAYPPVSATGYVDSYVKSGGATNPGEIMKCFSPAQLPVLNALAREFAVCDGWRASMPGPTWPNRFFMMAASSGGLDHSPNVAQIGEWMTVDGFGFEHGTLFDALSHAGQNWRIYHGDQGPLSGGFPVAGGLKGIAPWDPHPYSKFAADISAAGYPAQFTLIEPNYGDLTSDTYRGGQSQHPLDDVRSGEKLIKSAYEALRGSPLWDTSLLIVTWDEHGGFYDHVGAVPGGAVSPGRPGRHAGGREQVRLHLPAVRSAGARGDRVAAHPAEPGRSPDLRSRVDPGHGGEAVRDPAADSARPACPRRDVAALSGRASVRSRDAARPGGRARGDAGAGPASGEGGRGRAGRQREPARVLAHR